MVRKSMDGNEAAAYASYIMWTSGPQEARKTCSAHL